MLSQGARKKVQGKLPKKREIVDWGDTKVLQLLKFVDFFTVDDKFECKKDRIETARRRAIDDDELFWDEFLTRIDVENVTTKQFRYRFMTMARVTLAWLKSNPHAITAEMWQIMKENPRMQWAISSFKEVTNEMGATVVELQKDDETNPAIKNESPSQTQVKTPEAVYNQSLLTMATMFQNLLKGVSQADIKDMKAEKRVELANKLAQTLSKSFSNYRPNTQVFQQINFNKASREELEKANLQYAQAQHDE